MVTYSRAPIRKSEVKQLAKEHLAEAVGTAYYKFSDGQVDEFNNLTEEERDYFWQQFNKYAEAMCKAIGKEYITY